MGAMLSILPLLMALSLLGIEAPGAQRAGAVTIALGPAARAARIDLPEILGSPDPNRPLVVIDPGHGGWDPGALSPFGVKEKDATLGLARSIAAELAASPRLRVALTRDNDRALSLSERFELARRMRADLFVSIHADAAPHNQGARGATVYTLSEVASDRQAAALAQRENGAEFAGGADRSDSADVDRILIDLAQREAMAASADFARLLHREASLLVPFQPDYHRFASLAVLKAPDIPSLLFETGYLTNREDAAFLQSTDGRRRIAQGLRRAAEIYFARRSLASG